MFIRRLYYNHTTGEMLHSYMMNGDIKPIAVEEETKRLGLEDWHYMEWTTPDPETEKDFEDSYGRVSVDLSGDEPVLNFDFSPLPDPEPTEFEQYYNAVASELGGI